MSAWLRSGFTVVTALFCVVACAAHVSAQGTPQDSVRARQVVDSLVRAGAYRLPAPETVRVRADSAAPDTTAAAAPRGFTLDNALHLTSFIAGLLVLAALVTATVLFARRFFKALDRRSAIGVRTHWGGFGGGDSGWELTPALSLLVGTVVLAILTAVIASALLSAAGGRSNADRAASSQAQP